MSLLLLPQSIISDIVIRCLFQASFSQGWELRRVCNVFNDEVLFAYFVLKLKLRSLDISGPCPAYACDAFFVRSRLQKHLATTPSDTQAWLTNIRHALAILRSRLGSQICTSDVASGYKSHRFPLFQKANPRTIPENWASEAICGAVVSYFEFHELEDHISRDTESNNSEYLQRSPSFWLFAVACIAGDLALLYDIFADLQIRFEPMGGSGARQTHYLQYGLVGKGERQPYHWKDALSPCLSIAARRGHAQIVQYLLGRGCNINAVSPQNVTPLLAAVETRQVEVLKILLDPSREWQRIGRHYDDAMIKAARISDNALRWEILMLLTDNDTRKMSQKARDDMFFLASEVNNLTLAKWAMSHGAIDMFGFMPDITSSPTPLSIAVNEDHVEIFRLIINNIDTFIPVTEQKRDKTLRHAYSAACRGSKLEAFLALMKLQREMTPEQAFVQAAMVDGASAVVEDLIGSIDVHTASQHVLFALGDDAGQQALYLATRALRFLNVKFLLKRGCRLWHDATSMRLLPYAQEQIKSDPILCQRVVDLLAEYGCTIHIRK